MIKTQVVVLGGGPGGYAAAFMAADLGLQTTIVDQEPKLGGVCLLRGCIPSKALLHVAKLMTETREAGDMGLDFPKPSVNLDKLRDWKNSVIGQMTGGLDTLAKQRKVNHIQGRGTFTNATSLRVQKTDGGEEEVQFEHCILATGSQPSRVPGISIDDERVMDSTGALELRDIPKSMLVVGGGYIGLELGTVYAALGTQVTVVELTAGLLPGVDRDLVTFVKRRMDTHFHSILLNTKVAELKPEQDGIKVRLEGQDVKEPEQTFDRVLVSVGRAPNTKNLGLENTKVELDQKGFVKVDPQRRTAEPTIFAIGDIAGQPMLAHKASHEGRIAAEVIAGHNVIYDPHAIPAVVFTDPEIAWCGLSETEAQRDNIPIKVARFPWAASGRATTLDRNDGVTKLVVDPETERILGVGIAGVGAGELIAEGVLAIEMAAVVTDVAESIHPHPTLSETVMEAAEIYFGQSTHVFRPRSSRQR